MLTNIGFPGSINFISEILCFCGILQYNFSYTLIFLFFGLLVNTIYNFWFFNKVFFGTFLFTDNSYQQQSDLKNKKIKTLYQDITKREFITLIILVFWLIIWGIFPEKLISFCQIHLIYLNIRSLS